MRPNPAILLVFLLAGCSGGPGASASVNALPSESAQAPSPSAGAASPAASPVAPDWSALERLDPLVTATAPLDTPWPSLFATATADGVWLPNGNERALPAVVRIAPETLTITATIELGGEVEVFPPDAWATAPSRDGVWVALAYQKAVALVDPRTNSVSRRFEVDATPYSLAEGGDTLWIADWEHSEVIGIDVATGAERVRIEGIRDPTEIAIGDEGLWVNEHATRSIVRLDPTTGEELARLAIGGRPGVELGLGGIWARSDDEQILSRIDPDTNAVVATIQLPGNPTDVAIAGGSVWVAVTPQRGGCERTSYLVRIDPDANEVDGIMDLPCPSGVVSEGTRLWAGTVEDDQLSILRLDPGARA